MSLPSKPLLWTVETKRGHALLITQPSLSSVWIMSWARFQSATRTVWWTTSDLTVVTKATWPWINHEGEVCQPAWRVEMWGRKHLTELSRLNCPWKVKQTSSITQTGIVSPDDTLLQEYSQLVYLARERGPLNSVLYMSRFCSITPVFEIRG